MIIDIERAELRVAATVERNWREHGEIIFPSSFYATFITDPLDEDAIRMLELVGGVETDSTKQYFNAIALTGGDVYRDPMIRQTFAPWGVEESAHGIELNRVIAACRGDERVLTDRWGPLFELKMKRKENETFAQRHSQGISSLVGLLLKNPVAIYAFFGMMQEHTAYNFYPMLIERIDDPRVTELLSAFTPQETRHFRNYKALLDRELAYEPDSIKEIALAVKYKWDPLGYKAMGPDNWKWLLDQICSSDDNRSRILNLDNFIKTHYPELAHLSPMKDALNSIDNPESVKKLDLSDLVRDGMGYIAMRAKPLRAVRNRILRA